jgi:transcriptional regulator with XRE-family HTH domain
LLQSAVVTAAICNNMNFLGNMRKTFADRLKQYREARNWTQYDLAAHFDLSVGAVRGYEQQTRWPSPEELERIAKALGTTPGDLVNAGDPAVGATATDGSLRRLLPILAALDEHQLGLVLGFASGLNGGPVVGKIDRVAKKAE